MLYEVITLPADRPASAAVADDAGGMAKHRIRAEPSRSRLGSVAAVRVDAAELAGRTGRIALIVPSEGGLSAMGRRLDRLTRGAVSRA